MILSTDNLYRSRTGVMALSVYIGREPLGDVLLSYRASNILYNAFSCVGRFVRYSWNGLRNTYDSKRVMKYAIKNDRELLFRLSHDTLGVSASTALLMSSKYGKPKFMVIVISEWRASNLDDAMIVAASSGHLDCMETAYNMGSTAVNRAMAAAAANGHVRCVRRCVTLGATDFNGAFIDAAVGGELECMFFLKDCGATNMEEGYSKAYTARQPACAHQCRAWMTSPTTYTDSPVNISKWIMVNDKDKKTV
jgi:hypothetical protein